MKLTKEEVALLTQTAFAITTKFLCDKGNRPHPKHLQALEAILDSMANMASGSLQGRWAFGLQTGLGKTTCATAFCAALARLNLLDRVSVVIAAQDVEALCETWDTMTQDLGISEKHIGLLHRKPDARHQATENAIQRPLLLLCHARVKERFLDQFQYQGEMRDLLIYDESLMTTRSSTCSSKDLSAIAGAFHAQCEDSISYRKKYGELSIWLDEVREAVKTEIERLKTIASTQSVMLLPQRSEETLTAFEELVSSKGNHGGHDTILSLLAMCPTPVKVANFKDKGIMSFQVAVPMELHNIIVLDASNPIRDLVKYDRTILNAEEHLPKFKALGCRLTDLKTYPGTIIYRMKAGGGKSSIARSLGHAMQHNSRLCKEAVEVLRTIPQHQATLIIAFRPIYQITGTVNCVKALEDAINLSGIATMEHQQSKETISVIENGKTVEKPRISIITWGLHKGTNRYKYCQNEIQMGIIHRHPLDLLGEIGGREGLETDQTERRVRDIQMSEVAHDCFQAIGRIRCRSVVDGQALPVKVWLIEYSNSLQERLEPVMTGRSCQ